MPKHDWLTPKAIANRIKSKGLQKLRWYCQMCQKQCRDENGFKCHTMSESHQRQLLLVAENPGRYIHAFSDEFLRDFMFLLSRQYGTRRVHANEVYQQYIKDKNHFHMNATRWVTLTGFVKWLGREGLCEVEPTPKGWFIKYIDRSPEALARQAAAAKKEKMDKDDEERSQKIIEEQIARATAGKTEEDTPVYTELQRENEEEKVVFSLSKKASEHPSGEEPPLGDGLMPKASDEQPSTSTCDPSSDTASAMVGDEASASGGEVRGEEGGGGSTHSKDPPGKVKAIPNALKVASVKASSVSKGKEKEGQKESRKRKISALEEIRMMEEQRKEKMNRRDNWLAEGIVVKVVHKKLGERYYRRKGVVEEVKDLYTATVRMIDSGDKLKIDQAHLETVIPAIGKPVLVVNGAYRGLRAILESLDTDNFCVSVKINQGPSRGRVVTRVPYEDISKLNVDS